MGVWYAICHLSSDYPATCNASLAGGCVLCYISPIQRLAMRVLQVGVFYAICHLSDDLQCRVLQVGVCYAICHLSGDLQCESCDTGCVLCHLSSILYLETCNASLVKGCVLCCYLYFLCFMKRYFHT